MLLHRVLLNLGLQVSVTVERDCRVIDSRFEHEGWSFLSITLPSLCDALDQALCTGRLTPSMYEGFKPCRRGGKLPAFMAGFFRRVFEEDGALLDVPCIDSIYAIRQVTRLFKKVEIPCSPARVKQAYERYVSNDAECQMGVNDPVHLRRVAGFLWTGLEELSDVLYCAPGVFGSGACAEKTGFNARHSITRWPARSEASFPLSYHSSYREDCDSFDGITVINEDEEQPVRVVQVPKTLKTPRTISVEPSYMMLMQQSVAKILMDYLEGDHFPYESIRFTDQTVNRELARLGSVNGGLATIDLKDASDLVSNDLVKHIFGVAPSFLNLIQDCRSTKAKLPDGSSITLRKFASMGSALCFPLEAMTFFTIVMGSLVRQSGKRLSTPLLKRLAANVSVYGDDIVVPASTAAGVMEDLEAYGLRVNHNKSFTTGLFRESCGGDYYKGEDITPAYVRQWDHTGTSREAKFVAASVSLSNQFYMKGLWHASQYIRDFVECRYRKRLPRTVHPVGGLTWASRLFDVGLKWDTKRSGWRVKAPVVTNGVLPDELVDIRAVLLRCFQGHELSEHRRVFKASSRAARSFRPVDGGRTHARGDGLPDDGRPAPEPRVYDSWRRQWEDLHMAKPQAQICRNLGSAKGIDQLTSVDSYSSYTKSRWVPVHDTGIVF